jgi:hypothetical protein
LIFLVFYSYFLFIPATHFYFHSVLIASFYFFSLLLFFYSSFNLFIRYNDSFSSLDFIIGTNLSLYFYNISLRDVGADFSFVLKGKASFIFFGMITGWNILSALLTSLFISSILGAYIPYYYLNSLVVLIN